MACVRTNGINKTLFLRIIDDDPTSGQDYPGAVSDPLVKHVRRVYSVYTGTSVRLVLKDRLALTTEIEHAHQSISNNAAT